MAKKEEKVVEEIQPTETKNENKISEPEKKEVKKEGGDMKVKLPKTPKQFVNEKDNEPVKVDLRKKKEEVVEEENTTKVDLTKKEEVKEEPKEEVKEEVKEEKTPILEEIVEEEPVVKTEKEVKETVDKQVEKLEEKGYPVFFADIDDDPILAESHQIRSVPSILVEQDGQVVERMVGVQDPATLIAKFELYSPLPNEG